MPARILEIGGGPEPAIQNPGTLFEDEVLEYFSADPQGVGLTKVPEYNMRRSAIINGATRISTGVRAAMEALPYRDEAFSHVIMKNVLGEYTLTLLDENRGADSVFNISGRSFNQTLTGLHEVYRVLESAGRLAIAEEDTPADSAVVAAKLSDIGFTGVTVIPYCADSFETFTERNRHSSSLYGTSLYGPEPDQAWLQVRTQYWRLGDVIGKYGQVLMDMDDRPSSHYRWSYLLSATKP